MLPTDVAVDAAGLVAEGARGLRTRARSVAGLGGQSSSTPKRSHRTRVKMPGNLGSGIVAIAEYIKALNCSLRTPNGHRCAQPENWPIQFPRQKIEKIRRVHATVDSGSVAHGMSAHLLDDYVVVDVSDSRNKVMYTAVDGGEIPKLVETCIL